MHSILLEFALLVPSLSEVRQFPNFDIIHPANRLWMMSEVEFRGHYL